MFVQQPAAQILRSTSPALDSPLYGTPYPEHLDVQDLTPCTNASWSSSATLPPRASAQPWPKPTSTAQKSLATQYASYPWAISLSTPFFTTATRRSRRWSPICSAPSPTSSGPPIWLSFSRFGGAVLRRC